MNSMIRLMTCLVVLVLLSPSHLLAQRPATTAPSKVTGVTIYQGSALVTREVSAPAGMGAMELVVTPLPPATIDSSLYSEGADGTRVLSTRYRTRAVMNDIRTEVRAKEEELKALANEAEKMQKQVAVLEQNLALLSKMENFTTATMQQLSEKGVLNADTAISLSNHVMTQRAQKMAEQVNLQQALRANAEAAAFARRQLDELSSGSSKTERDAVIVIDKTVEAAGTIRLNYLVSNATWKPQYKLRANGELDPVQVEYLAGIQQMSGEEWNDVSVILSTAEPMLSAAPPDLVAMDVTVDTGAGRGGRGGFSGPTVGRENREQQRAQQMQGQQEFNRNNFAIGNGLLNSSGALRQTDELFGSVGASSSPSNLTRTLDDISINEGPSVTYHLRPKFSLPSRNDDQLLEIVRLEMSPSFYYKAVPVLTPHVYRQAELTNSTEYVLLPGEATMYLGTDFVGRMQLPLVAIGERFTAGFGVDPQLQVTRELTKKNRTLQGGNQVHELSYRIRIASYKPTPAVVQVWDRLPRAESESVGVTLIDAAPSLSTDATYVRADRPQNLLRWDLTIEPNANGERSATINYSFKMEYDRNVAVGNLTVQK